MLQCIIHTVQRSQRGDEQSAERWMTPVHMLEILLISLIVWVWVVVSAAVITVIWLNFQDINQKKHSVRRNDPVLGKL